MLKDLVSLSRRRLVLATALIAAAALTGAAPAVAAQPTGSQYSSFGQYGEVWRGGGFDKCWYDNGAYDGNGASNNVSGCTADETSPAPGLFVDPVGFAVDNNDPDPSGSNTAIYVLDRTSALPADLTNAGAVTTWRLQKLSITKNNNGTYTTNVLGTDEFSLPADTVTVESDQVGPNQSTITDYEMFGLTVDPASGRVYSLLVGYDGNTGQEAVQEIVSWSTTPQAGQLVAASNLPASDTVGIAGIDGFSAPGVLSGVSTKQLYVVNSNLQFSGDSDLEAPTGLAIDSTGGTNYVAVQALDPTAGASGGAGIVTVSPTTGAVVKNWSSVAFQNAINYSGQDAEAGAGISTDPDASSPSFGSLTYLTDEGTGIGDFGGIALADDFDVASLPASLPTNLPSSPAPVLSSFANALSSTNGGSLDLDDAAVAAADVLPESYDDGTPFAATATSSPQIIALSNGLYAGVFEPDAANVADPFNPAGQPGIWTPLAPGIRLIAPDQFGSFNTPTTDDEAPLTTLYDTLGNQATATPGSTTAATACNLSDPTSAGAGAPTYPSLAAGSGGAIWVLTNGQDTSDAGNPEGVVELGDQPAAAEGGRELIELAPNAGTPCPSPSGTFTMDAGSQSVAASASNVLTVSAGTTVNFDASTITYHGAAPAEYAWSFGDNSANNVDLDNGVNQMWPTGTASHQYTTPGTYTVTLDLYGDYGQYVETGQIDVVAVQPAQAAFSFSPSAPQVGQTVTLNASSSLPSTGASGISLYEWTIAGVPDNTSSSTITWTPSAASSGQGYPVTLKVVDTNNNTSQAVTQFIQVSPATVTTPTPTTTTATTTAQTTTTSSVPSNAFTIGAVSAKAKNRAISAQVTVQSPGTLKIVASFKETITVRKHGKTKHETKVVSFGSVTKAVASGSNSLSISPGGAAAAFLRELSSHSSLGVTLQITFTPNGGTANAQSSGVRVPGLKSGKKK